jgi:polar amino acid transport system substrate-binding protein
MLRAVVLAASLTILAAACGAGAPPTDSPTQTLPPSATPSTVPNPSASTSPALDAALVRPGELVICSSFPRTRFAEYDSAGRPFGVDIEMGQALAQEMGLVSVVEEVAFEELIGAVAGGGQCDVSIAGQFITSARLQQIDMIPYREGAPHVIVRDGNPGAILSLDDLCGRGFSVVAGTVYADMVRGEGDYAGAGIQDRCSSIGRQPVQLMEFNAQDDAEGALAAGDVEAYAGNDFVTVEQPDTFELAFELPRARNGIGHHKDLLLLDDALRAALRAIIADGTYLGILDRYGSGDAALTITP